MLGPSCSKYLFKTRNFQDNTQTEHAYTFFYKHNKLISVYKSEKCPKILSL